MLEYLDIQPGAVSVMGLMNDAENSVTLLIDEDLLHDEFIGCHPCVNTSSLKLCMNEGCVGDLFACRQARLHNGQARRLLMVSVES